MIFIQKKENSQNIFDYNSVAVFTECLDIVALENFLHK